MLPLVISLIGPLAAAPLIAYLSRHLFALFLRQGAELFAGAELHKQQAAGLGVIIAINSIAIFTLAWWTAVGFSAAKLSIMLVLYHSLSPLSWA